MMSKSIFVCATLLLATFVLTDALKCYECTDCNTIKDAKQPDCEVVVTTTTTTTIKPPGVQESTRADVWKCFMKADDKDKISRGCTKDLEYCTDAKTECTLCKSKDLCNNVDKSGATTATVSALVFIPFALLSTKLF